VLVAPVIVLFVSVSMVARPTRVSVDVGRSRSPPLCRRGVKSFFHLLDDDPRSQVLSLPEMIVKISLVA